MNTLLKEILLLPELKSGIIIAPCLSGKTHALCAKAIQLASEGQEVLLVSPSISVAKARGGVVEELNKQLKESKHPYRISQESLNIQVSSGKIKVCDLTFIPDKNFDTMIAMDNISNPLRIGFSCKVASHSIYCTTAYDLAAGYREPYNEARIAITRNLIGDVAGMELQRFNPAHYEDDSAAFSFNDMGYFTLVIKQPHHSLTSSNEVYMSHVENLDVKTKLRMLETDILTCYKHIYGQ